MSASRLSQRLVESLAGHGVKAASPLPRAFEDSTNDLWRLHRRPGPDWLMRIPRPGAEDTPFWRGMSGLFGWPLNELESRYRAIARLSPLRIPGPVGRIEAMEDEAHFVTEWLVGEPAVASPANAERLGHHLAALHDLSGEGHGKAGWWERLAEVLETLGGDLPHTRHYADAARRLLAPAEWGWVLPDIRWDQFLMREGRLDALVDIEAFVVGPPALDFIALEYQLDDEQARRLVAAYRKHRPLPDLATCRAVYRYLFFLMGILGETDLERWMAHPPLLDQVAKRAG